MAYDFGGQFERAAETFRVRSGPAPEGDDDQAGARADRGAHGTSDVAMELLLCLDAFGRRIGIEGEIDEQALEEKREPLHVLFEGDWISISGQAQCRSA